MRPVRTIFIACFALLLCSCGLSPVGGAPSKLEIEEMEATFAAPTVPTLLIRQTTPAASTIPAEKQNPVTAAPAILPAAQPAATEEQFPLPTVEPVMLSDPWLCSPLEFVELEDLPRVMSDEYRPPVKPGSDARHQGVDFAYIHWKGNSPLEGTPVRSSLGGRVAASIRDSFPFGNLVIVETKLEQLPEAVWRAFGIIPGESLYLLYGHMDTNSPAVSLGDELQPCAPVGFVGKTGNTAAAHLHLEARLGPAGSQFNQFSYYRDEDPKEARDNYKLWRTSGVFRHFDPLRLMLFEQNGGASWTPTPSWPNLK